MEEFGMKEKEGRLGDTQSKEMWVRVILGI